MDDAALYRAVLADPHDDTPRLVYADWLDESAGQLPGAAGRSARARAEFIRLQCALARAGPAGWRQPDQPTTDLALARRERRLLFTHGRKWRRAAPPYLASSPFDRGFLRPHRALDPAEFLSYDDDWFRAAPLWDVHLYASGWHNDPDADHGQYGPLLAEVGRSPALERAGWLQVSFFATPTADFLRTGSFPNVETLVLNCGPFPDVLAAVAENPSFRNLRYVSFGPDRWAWAGGWAAGQHLAAIEPGLEAANRRHLRYGEMRAAVRVVLGAAAWMADPPEPAPAPPAAPAGPLVERLVPYPTAEMPVGRFLASLGLALAVPVAVLVAASITTRPSRTPDPGLLDGERLRRALEPLPPLDPALFKVPPAQPPGPADGMG
ncbi:MAG: hypothetical protein C0501_19255 [Isosphaera sp.]|nr:hypothetical protein [Isosphaera sp.]